MNIDFESLDDLLLNIVEQWEKDPSPQVQTVARLTREELGKACRNTARSQDYVFPDLSSTTIDTETKEIFENILKVNEKLSWRIPFQHMGGDSEGLVSKLGSADNIMFAMMVGTGDLDAQYLSHKVYVGLGWLAPGTLYPPHAHQAKELYHVVKGSAEWGPSPADLAVRGPGEILVHQSGQPHMMVVPQDQYLLAVYAWTGEINGSYWWCE